MSWKCKPRDGWGSAGVTPRLSSRPDPYPYPPIPLPSRGQSSCLNIGIVDGSMGRGFERAWGKRNWKHIGRSGGIEVGWKGLEIARRHRTWAVLHNNTHGTSQGVHQRALVKGQAWGEGEGGWAAAAMVLVLVLAAVRQPGYALACLVKG
ncbi:hypothetical protein BJV74DRAFT_795397 [Russula compacta]|nr:hypothetical protein BJV74DRAFT_795397 [Russula compacta]